MQLSQACPRCGYNQIKSFRKGSVRLVEGYIPQYLSMIPAAQAAILALGPMFVIQMAVTLLHDHKLSLTPGPMTPAGQYFFAIVDFLGLVCAILFVVGLIPYFLAPLVKGWEYRCANCKFAWAEMENNHPQTFEHIRYRQTRFNQAHIIEGVVCPKDSCNSTSIVSKPLFYNYTHIPNFKIFKPKYLNHIMFFLFVVVVAELFIDKLRETFSLIPFGLLVLLNVAPLAKNRWLEYQKAQLKGRTYVCLNCHTLWGVFVNSPQVNKSRQKWFEIETQRAQKKNDQRGEANSLVGLAGIIGDKLGNWQEATRLLTRSAELYQRLNISIVPTNYYLLWAGGLLETGKLQEAQEMINQGLSQGAKERNWPNYEQVAQATQGMIYLKAEQLEEARQAFRDNLTLFRKIEGYQPKSEPVALRGLAEIALKEGMVVQALQLCGAYQAMLDQAGIILLPKEQDQLQGLIEAARSQLDTPTYLAAWREGSQMSFDQAIEYAFRLTAAPLG